MRDVGCSPVADVDSVSDSVSVSESVSVEFQFEFSVGPQTEAVSETVAEIRQLLSLPAH